MRWLQLRRWQQRQHPLGRSRRDNTVLQRIGLRHSFSIQTQSRRVFGDKPAHVDRLGQSIRVRSFQGLQDASLNFGGRGHGFNGQALAFATLSQLVANINQAFNLGRVSRHRAVVHILVAAAVRDAAKVGRQCRNCTESVLAGGDSWLSQALES